MASQYEIRGRLPSLEEYRKICEAVGWGTFVNFEAARKALPNSLYGVVAICQNEVVGMGRVVGDGAIFYYLQDIAVLPYYQRQGIGQAITNQLMHYIRETGPEKAFIGLFAAAGKEVFYEKYGFQRQPGGMAQYLVKDNQV